MKRKKVITMIAAALAFTMTVCGSSTAIAASELTAESKPATQYTIDANQEVYALLDFEDTAEFENATKGLLASPDTANPMLIISVESRGLFRKKRYKPAMCR